MDQVGLVAPFINVYCFSCIVKHLFIVIWIQSMQSEPIGKTCAATFEKKGKLRYYLRYGYVRFGEVKKGKFTLTGKGTHWLVASLRVGL